MSEHQDEFNVKVEELILELVEELRETVEHIESMPEITKGHYDSYLTLITTAARGNARHGMLVGTALIRAGANHNGVMSAMKLTGFLTDQSVQTWN